MLDVFLDFLLGMVLGCLGGLFGIGGGLRRSRRWG